MTRAWHKEELLEPQYASDIVRSLGTAFKQLYPTIASQFTYPGGISTHTLENSSYEISFFNSPEAFGCYSTIANNDSDQYAFCTIRETQKTRGATSTYLMNFGFNKTEMVFTELFDVEYHTAARGCVAICTELVISIVEKQFKGASLRL